MNTKTACDTLREFNQWRRGEGEYTWNEDPSKNKALPVTPKEIGEAIDQVLAVVGGLARSEEEGGRVVVNDLTYVFEKPDGLNGAREMYVSTNAMSDLWHGKCIVLPMTGLEGATLTMYLDKGASHDNQH